MKKGIIVDLDKFRAEHRCQEQPHPPISKELEEAIERLIAQLRDPTLIAGKKQ